MTDAAIIAQYEEFMDGQNTLSQTLEIQLANSAKNKLETELKLEITKDLDSSNASIVGGSYTTPYSLPTLWFSGMGYIYVGPDKYLQVPFERREFYKTSAGFFYIDQRRQKLYLTGTVNVAQTITIPYLIATADMTAETVAAGTTTVTWPDRFHTVIAMEMAKRQYTIDAGDKNRAWDDRWGAMYQEEKAQLINWDADLKLNSIANQVPYGPDTAINSENKINNLS